MTLRPVDYVCVHCRRHAGSVLVALLAVLGSLSAADAQENAVADKRIARSIRISLPITGQTVDRAEQFVRRAIEKAQAGGTHLELVFQLVVPPHESQYGRGSGFGVALQLARYLSSAELAGVRTVAYIPQSIQGHAVLVALACDEIIMAKEATIGMAGVDEKVIDEACRAGYREIAGRRKTIPADVALWMLDPTREVLVVETDLGREYVTPSGLEDLKKEKQFTIKSQRKLFDPDFPDRSLAQLRGQLSGAEARSLNFVSYLAENRQEMARALEIPPQDLEEDPDLVGGWRAIRVDLKGPISEDSAAQVRHQIEDEVRTHDINFVCLYIDSPGGSLPASITLAYFLSKYEPAKVRTVAYIPQQARSDAALVALACHQVILHPQAELGGPGARVFSRGQIADAMAAVHDENGPWKSRSWSLVAAIIDPMLTVYRCTRLDQVEYFCQEELDEYQRKHPDAKPWQKGLPVTRFDEQFVAVGQQAVAYGLATRTVEDFEEFKQYYGLEHDPALMESTWANFLIEALASQGVSAFLLMIGFIALYVELHSPGVGIGGFVAAVCFVLFFWSHYLGGTAGWLEVALFAVGLCCLLLEFFVLPGFAIFGLGGGALVLLSLILASQTFVLPHNAYQFAQLQRSLLTIAGAAVGFVAAASLLRKWLPQAPIFKQVLLPPPSGEEAQRIRSREVLANFEDLVGARGMTATQLTPSGKARFGDRLIDVITDGDVVRRGTEVEVIAVYGTRVIVKAVESGKQ